jgi:hypothetical protein
MTINLTLPDHPKMHLEYKLSSSANRVTITKTKDQSISTQKFLTTKRQVNNMPKDSARGSVSEAEVVLAFPLGANDIPVIEDQFTFAFLPLRKLGFKVSYISYYHYIH